MERRKWLFRRKSSDKSVVESESSGSVSSHSDRCSDEQQETFRASPNTDTQSSEVISEPVGNDEGVNGNVKILTEKLSAALVNISAKDELVKQHAKVAEEAVAGWEKAENEATALKGQLEAAIQRNSVLENQVSHLDEALKECVRQLRLTKEEQEQKIYEAVLNKTLELETTKYEMENQLLELKSDLPGQSDPGFRYKLQSLARENSTLKVELQSQYEELHIRTIESNLSTQAAEAASKQHLESIKKIGKLEAECRRLKTLVSRSLVANDSKSATASSVCVESITDGLSESEVRLNVIDIATSKMRRSLPNRLDSGGSDSWASALIIELDQFKNQKVTGRNPASSIEIDLMDDFLEMERLAALPKNNSGSHSLKFDSVDKDKSESTLRIELEAMTQRAAVLEERLKSLQAEKTELEMALVDKYESESTLKTELEAMTRQASLMEEKLEILQAQKTELEMALTRTDKDDGASIIKTELEAMTQHAAELKEKLERLQAEKTTLEMVLVDKYSNESTLKTELEVMTQRAAEMEDKLERLQAEKTKFEMVLVDKYNDESMLKSELESMTQCAAELEQMLERLRAEKTELKMALVDKEDGESNFKSQLEAMTQLAAEMEENLKRLEAEKTELQALSRGHGVIEASEFKLKEAEIKFGKLENELSKSNEMMQFIESQLVGMEAVGCTLSAKVDSLESEAKKEMETSSQIAIKCQQLEEELATRELEAQLQKAARSNCESKIKQEGLAVAAEKFAECQKTIASLENQLKSLATLENFLIDTAILPEYSGGSLAARANADLWKLQSDETYFLNGDSDFFKLSRENYEPTNVNKGYLSPSQSSSSPALSSNHGSSDRNKNGFANFFSRTKNGIQLEI